MCHVEELLLQSGVLLQVAPETAVMQRWCDVLLLVLLVEHQKQWPYGNVQQVNSAGGLAEHM